MLYGIDIFDGYSRRVIDVFYFLRKNVSVEFFLDTRINWLLLIFLFFLLFFYYFIFCLIMTARKRWPHIPGLMTLTTFLGQRCGRVVKLQVVFSRRKQI